MQGGSASLAPASAEPPHGDVVRGIPETAHFLMMEKPIEFNRMLLRFVEKFK